MSLLIADSGSTKTEWSYVSSSGEEKLELETEGLNPYYHTLEGIRRITGRGVHARLEGREVEEIHFYGAGVDSPRREKTVATAIGPHFPGAGIHVHHDLLGAARACFFDEAGIACILGTGMNSCRYDGRRITEHIPSLAFVLGDEASAGWFGKRLINDYFRYEMPDELREALAAECDMELEAIHRGVYDEQQPSRFVASYASFMGRHPESDYVKSLLREGFQNLAGRILAKYSGAGELEVRFVGSVAYAHRKLIARVLEERGMKAGLFIRKPMQRLVEFHLRPG
ncbi:MAG: hypothetical protein U5K31_05010 [Balneolaceae bacterium]|nr:hypothetical protein [Balneolaceae bacterium]